VLSTKQRGLISASPYATSGGTRYAVVMVPNTGANAKTWWWYVGTTSFLSTQLSTNNARMIEVNPIAGSTTTYLGLMVSNASTNATGLVVYVHASVPSISSLLSTNHARLVDLSRTPMAPSTSYVLQPEHAWYWYVGSSPSPRCTAPNSRVSASSMQRRTSSAARSTTRFWRRGTRNAQSETLWNLIGPTVDSGAYGFYLKQVGGPVIAASSRRRRTTGRAALKVLYHAKSIHAESLGNTHGHRHDHVPLQPGRPTNPASAPTTSGRRAHESENADQQMMWNSDNR